MIEIKNKSAHYEYFISTVFEAGIVLLGTEVKSLREKKISFGDSYCFVQKSEIYIRGLHINEYKLGTTNNHDCLRERKLLLRKKEIKKISKRIKEDKLTLVPLKIYINEKEIFKMEIGLAKRKKLHDKRQSIKKREMEREIKSRLK